SRRGEACMSFYTSAVSRVLFPMHERLKGHRSVRVRESIEQSQWWEPRRLRELQLQRLQALLSQAEQHVPYYRDVFARLGLSARDVRSFDDLSVLPLLAKGDIRRHMEALKSERARGLMRFNTGGSTGEPLIFW